MASANSVLADVDSFLQEIANSSVSPSHQHHPPPHQHDHHDHSVHSSPAGHDTHGGHEGHVMKMWFHGGWNEVILFDFWRIDSFSGLVLSFIAIFIMGAMYEGIKWFRVYLQMNNSMADLTAPKENGISLQHVVHDKAPLQNEVVRSGSNEDVYNPTTTPPSHAVRSHNRRASPYSNSSPCSSVRLIQAALYVIQLVLAYWLMLIVMTYNTWLTIAVILGAGFGHWLFAVLKLREPTGETADSFATDACH